MSTDRTRVDAPRSDETREWELFVRDDDADALRHVGSVTAPSATVAHEVATPLVGDVHTVWCAPSDAVARFTAGDLGGDADESDETHGPTGEADATDADAGRDTSGPSLNTGPDPAGEGSQ
jgi:rSAM-partnered protein